MMEERFYQVITIVLADGREVYYIGKPQLMGKGDEKVADVKVGPSIPWPERMLIESFK